MTRVNPSVVNLLNRAEIRLKLKVNEMKIESLTLKNYRCFENGTINFDKQLTVLVGENGSGKTALLDSVAIVLGGIIHYAVPKNIFRYELSHKRDKSFNSNSELMLQAKIKAFDRSYIWTDPVVDKSKGSENTDVNIVTYGKNSNEPLIAKLINSSDVYPLIAYYSSYRLLGSAISSGERKHDRNRLDAYDSCFTPELEFNKVVTWLDSEDAKEARNIRDGKKNISNHELKTLHAAINKALPGYKDFRFIDSPPEFALTRKSDGQPVTFMQLSAGYRIMFALVLDLARRMAVANGDLFAQRGKSPLESPAIVLIDEIELHLHPSWQQTVLPSLMEIFPNTQFVVTTHSPQVLTSVSSEHIRILSDGKIYDAPPGSQGAESSRLLKRILGVDSRPPADPVTEQLEKYKQLVYADKWDTPEAQTLRRNLDKAFVGEDPILTELDLYINNRKWELEQ